MPELLALVLGAHSVTALEGLKGRYAFFFALYSFFLKQATGLEISIAIQLILFCGVMSVALG